MVGGGGDDGWLAVMVMAVVVVKALSRKNCVSHAAFWLAVMSPWRLEVYYRELDALSQAKPRNILSL